MDHRRDALSGSVQVGTSTPEVTLPDLGDTSDCNLGLLPEGVAGEGIGFAGASVGSSVVFDLDSNLYCGDGQQDYEIAAGSCDHPASDFTNFLYLSALTPAPTSLCVRKVGGQDGLDLTILDLEPDFLRLLVLSFRTRFDVSFSAGLPKEVALPVLQAGSTYTLMITVTDGTTFPVK